TRGPIAGPHPANCPAALRLVAPGESRVPCGLPPGCITAGGDLGAPWLAPGRLGAWAGHARFPRLQHAADPSLGGPAGGPAGKREDVAAGLQVRDDGGLVWACPAGPAGTGGTTLATGVPAA